MGFSWKTGEIPLGPLQNHWVGVYFHRYAAFWIWCSGTNVPLKDGGRTTQTQSYCKWGRQWGVMSYPEFRQKPRKVWIKHLGGKEKAKPNPLLCVISLQPALLLLSAVKTFFPLRLLLRRNWSLLFHAIISEHTWSLLLRFWGSHLWDNCFIYPEYFFPPHFLKAWPCTTSASAPAACLSMSLEHWLARKGAKGDSCTLFSHNYKISSTYIKWCYQQTVWVFKVWWHINSSCFSIYLLLTHPVKLNSNSALKLR